MLQLIPIRLYTENSYYYVEASIPTVTTSVKLCLGFNVAIFKEIKLFTYPRLEIGYYFAFSQIDYANSKVEFYNPLDGVV